MLVACCQCWCGGLRVACAYLVGCGGVGVFDCVGLWLIVLLLYDSLFGCWLFCCRLLHCFLVDCLLLYVGLLICFVGCRTFVCGLSDCSVVGV